MKEEVKDKAAEPVTLKKGEVWMLRIAAATGVAGLLSHGADVIGKLLGLF
jgi:hypothetical protein